MSGTAAERTGGTFTNFPAGWEFTETDTNPPLTYLWTGSAWRLVTEKDVTETLTGKTLTSPTINTPTLGAPLTVANGGTGAGTLTGVLKGNGTSAITTAVQLAVADGGSGAATLTGILKGNGASAFTAVTAPSGAIVGDTDTQTLTAKTLTSPAINTPLVKFTDVSKVNTDSPYSILTTDDVIRADASGGALIVTLPTAVGVTGKTYTIRRIDILQSSVFVTVATTSSQTIAGATAEYLTPGDCIVVESDGANWQILARTPGVSNTVKGSTGNRRLMAGGLPGMCPLLLTSTTVPALDTLFALPLVLQKTTKCDLISFRITTVAGAGGVAMAGVYRDTGNCYPGELIFETGSIDITTGTIKDTTITAGLQVLPAGMYWLAWQCRVAAPQLKCLNNNLNIMTPFGSPTINANNPDYGYSVANASSTLPNPYTAAATALTTLPAVGVPIPAIGLRPI